MIKAQNNQEEKTVAIELEGTTQDIIMEYRAITTGILNNSNISIEELFGADTEETAADITKRLMDRMDD